MFGTTLCEKMEWKERLGREQAESRLTADQPTSQCISVFLRTCDRSTENNWRPLSSRRRFSCAAISFARSKKTCRTRDFGATWCTYNRNHSLDFFLQLLNVLLCKQDTWNLSLTIEGCNKWPIMPVTYQCHQIMLMFLAISSHNWL